MAYVFYDVETTGLDSRFDQIVQFAAVRTDADLNETGRFETNCRLLPYILPAPAALHATGACINELRDPGRPSHYEMVANIRSVLSSWSPAVFIGYNSMRFDEEFLRHAFFRCLLPPYLTSMGGSGRADALELVRALAAMDPAVLAVPVTEKGGPTFRLEALAGANGFQGGRAHEAMCDVSATLHLCRLAYARAPELWSRLVRFSRRAAVLAFAESEPAFFMHAYFDGTPTAKAVATLGTDPGNPNSIYCLDLSCDLGTLSGLTDAELTAALRSPPWPVRRLKANGGPPLCAVYEAPDRWLSANPEDRIMAAAAAVHGDPGLKARLLSAYLDGSQAREGSPHVELQLYDGFWSDGDSSLMARFNDAPWEQRVTLAKELRDPRLVRMARRLLHDERPDLLSAATLAAIAAQIRSRLCNDGNFPWLTAPAAIHDLDGVLATDVGGEARPRLERYREHLRLMLDLPDEPPAATEDAPA